MNINAFLLAVQFLTTIPVSIRETISCEEYRKALRFFPLVGMCIGMIQYLVFLITAGFGGLVSSALILITSILITGGVHLDGLADTFDGIYGGKSRQEVLEIMKDSHTGVMGVIGIVIIVLLKFALLASISRFRLGPVLICMGMFSRWAMMYACYHVSYARRKGVANFLVNQVSTCALYTWGALVLVGIIILLGVKGFFVAGAALIVVMVSKYFFTYKIGGITGDAIGALNEFSEASILLFSLFILDR